jgi:hypothetical protein
MRRNKKTVSSIAAALFFLLLSVSVGDAGVFLGFFNQDRLQAQEGESPTIPVFMDFRSLGDTSVDIIAYRRFKDTGALQSFDFLGAWKYLDVPDLNHVIAATLGPLSTDYSFFFWPFEQDVPGRSYEFFLCAKPTDLPLPPLSEDCGQIDIVVSPAPGPDVPTSLAATAVAADRVVLKWHAPVGRGSTYNIYRGSSEGDIRQVVNSAPLTYTTYSDTPVLPNRRYCYAVTALDGKESAKSASVCVTTPPLISLTPSSINQVVNAGVPVSVQVSVTSDGLPLTFTAASSDAWLAGRFSAAAGQLNLSIATTGMSGQYDGVITISGVNGVQATLPISLQVLPPCLIRATPERVWKGKGACEIADPVTVTITASCSAGGGPVALDLTDATFTYTSPYTGAVVSLPEWMKPPEVSSATPGLLTIGFNTRTNSYCFFYDITIDVNTSKGSVSLPVSLSSPCYERPWWKPLNPYGGAGRAEFWMPPGGEEEFYFTIVSPFVDRLDVYLWQVDYALGDENLHMLLKYAGPEPCDDCTVAAASRMASPQDLVDIQEFCNTTSNPEWCQHPFPPWGWWLPPLVPNKPGLFYSVSGLGYGRIAIYNEYGIGLGLDPAFPKGCWYLNVLGDRASARRARLGLYLDAH